MAEIYALLCPDTGDARYIGKANCAQRRYKGHMRDAARRKTPVYDWIRKLMSEGKAPVLDVILVCGGDWRDDERRIIREHRESGCRLLNLADGGDEPFCPTHVRAANGKANAIKRVSTPQKQRFYELKRNLNRMLSQGYVSAETRAKMRAAALKHPEKFGDWANV
jgi:hypothetical protein